MQMPKRNKLLLLFFDMENSWWHRTLPPEAVNSHAKLLALGGVPVGTWYERWRAGQEISDDQLRKVLQRTKERVVKAWRPNGAGGGPAAPAGIATLKLAGERQAAGRG